MTCFDEDLTPVLALSTNEDLDPLVQYIIKASLCETLTISELYKKFAPDHKQYVAIIEKEIREFGGNTLLNLFRGNGPAYIEIVGDVADKLGANFNTHSSVAEIESAIMLRIMSQAWEKMSPEEKHAFLKEMGIGTGIGSLPKAFPVALLQAAIKLSGFKAYQLALVVANAIAKALLGRGLSLAANAALTRWIALFSGPIGWLITGIWTLLDLAGPAYRVTIPCVVHIAMLRQQYSLLHCKACAAPYTAGNRFCPNCGAPIEQDAI